MYSKRQAMNLRVITSSPVGLGNSCTWALDIKLHIATNNEPNINQRLWNNYHDNIL